MIIIDTNILIDHVHGHARWLDSFLLESKSTLIVPTIVIAEYHTAQELETKEGFIKSREYLSKFTLFDLTPPIAEIVGKLLRRKSHVDSANLADLIIAATCISLNGKLATRNKKDFVKIPDLHFFTPPA